MDAEGGGQSNGGNTEQDIAVGKTMGGIQSGQENPTASSAEITDAGESEAKVGAGTTHIVVQTEGEATDVDTKTALNKLLAEKKERLLVCGKCMEDFQSPKRLPRVLPCHHAFCGECLQQLCKDNHIDCPLCRRSITVEGPFPVETSRLTLLDLKKIMEGQECEGCFEKVRAIAWCPKCQQSLCKDCCQTHKLIKATNDHSLESLAEAAIDPSKLLQLTEKCDKHEAKKLKFYCAQCQKVACRLCFTELHNKHSVELLQPILESKRKEMNTECQRLKKIMPTFQARVDSSTQRLQQIDAQRQKISSKVEEMFTEAEKLLKDRKEQILSELEAIATEDKQVLDDQQASDQSLLSEAQASLEYGERISLLGLPSQLLPGPYDMAKTCDDLEKRSTLPRNPDPVYEVDEGIEDLMEAVNRMGKIKRKAVDDDANNHSSSASADSTSRNQSKRQNCAGRSDERPPAQSAPELVPQRHHLEPSPRPNVSEEKPPPLSAPQPVSQRVAVLLLPRGGGTFQTHLESVGASLRKALERSYDVHFQTWDPGEKTRNRPVLIVFQSQGRPGDEFPGALPQELRGSSQRMVVALVQDDEITTAGKDIVPADVDLIGVVNIHVIPMQQHLHVDGSSLCTRNQQAVREIAQLLKAKRLASPGQQRLQSGNTNRSSPDTPPQKSSTAASFLQSREVKETVVGVLALPRSSGAFKEHLDSVTRSVEKEVQQVRKVRFAKWDPGHGSGDSIALIVFLSQGSPGVEFPGAIPQELRGSSQRVVVVVIQDDETSTADKNIVPPDVHLLAVVNVHVIPMQHQLHRQGSSLCARNQQAVKEIAHLLSP